MTQALATCCRKLATVEMHVALQKSYTFWIYRANTWLPKRLTWLCACAHDDLPLLRKLARGWWVDKRSCTSQHYITIGGQFFCQRLKCQTNSTCSSGDSSCFVLFAHTNLQWWVQADDETLEEVLLFGDLCRRKTQASPQFHVWYMTLQLELLYLVFLRSLRTSCLPLYDALQKLTPWFFRS